MCRRFGILCSIFIVGVTMKMELQCSEMSEYKIQTQGNFQNEIIEHSEHGESLKSRMSTN